MRRMTLAGIATLGILALTGCTASTKLTSVWTEPNFQTNSLKKLMVIAVAQNPSTRRMFEDTFAGALRKQGIEALASYSVLGDAAMDSVGIRAAVVQNGCDGVFVSRLVDQQTVDTYYPPSTSYVGTPYYGGYGYGGGYYGYYSSSYAVVSSPGYTVENQVIHLETNLYRAADSKLVWAALSESWLEQAADKAGEISPYVQLLVGGLAQSKVVVKGK